MEQWKSESEQVEFKVDIPKRHEKYMKTVVAFANDNGGQIVFGIDDATWSAVGIAREEVYDKMDAVTNAIQDSCEPQIVPRISIDENDGRPIIIVDVPAGMKKPYYIKRDGIIGARIFALVPRRARQKGIRSRILCCKAETNRLIRFFRILQLRFLGKAHRHFVTSYMSTQDPADRLPENPR